MPDYYAILEIQPGASNAEIKQAYRRLARLYHPDLNQQARDEKIKLLNEAYAVLSNPARRKQYDQQLLEAQVSPEPQMTWIEGIFGFVKELKKELREE